MGKGDDQNPFAPTKPPASDSAAQSAPRHSNQPAPDHHWPGEHQMAWTIWMAYGAFYFCRTNLSAANPGMTSSLAEGGLGLTDGEVGQILGAFKLTYAIGQLVNGQLAEVISPKKLLAVGIFSSALLNVAFGFSTAFYFLLFLWAMNGYAQSLGWPPCMRIVANWVSPVHRGKVIGLIGTGYQIAGVLTFIVAGFAAEHFGWQGALFVPAGILALSGVAVLFLLEERPRDGSTEGTPDPPESTPQRGTMLQNLAITLTNPALWLLGISLGLLNASRYGYIDWGIKHLTAVHPDVGIGTNALKYAVLPAGGILGSYLAGWATDRFFGSRRAPVAFLLLTLLGVLGLVYHSVAVVSVPATVFLLGCIGFCLFGPQVLLVGTAPSDLARQGTSAAAVGFVNALGYIGAAGGDIVTGMLRDQTRDWQTVTYVWASWAFGAAITSGILWNVAAKRDND